MAEISNSTLAILVFATLIGVVTSTVFLMNRETGYSSLSGFATFDSGNVTLTINASLNIQVDTTNKTIAFGGCTPRASTSYSCSSNDTQVCDGSGLSNCTGDTIVPQFIRDWVYDIISKNRYVWFGKKDSCIIPTVALKSKFLD